MELSATTAVARADGRTLNVVSGTATPSICLAGSARKRPRSVSGSASHGHEVSDRGRIPKAVIEAYQAAS